MQIVLLYIVSILFVVVVTLSYQTASLTKTSFTPTWLIEMPVF